jgi:hypothetical protein
VRGRKVTITIGWIEVGTILKGEVRMLGKLTDEELNTISSEEALHI